MNKKYKLKPINEMSEAEVKAEAALLLKEVENRIKYRKMDQFFPTEGPLSRKYYPKQMLHFKMGATHKLRLMICANQIGKTTIGALELVYHITGQYPEWWEGYRFKEANNWWAVGEDSKFVAGTLQPLLLGDLGDYGSGMVPKDALDFDTLTDATKTSTQIQSFRVKHVSGGYSLVEFKSFEQGREAFQSAQRNVWLDEEPPLDIFSECVTRGLTGDYRLMMTFTPLKGMTELITKFTDNDPSDGDKGDSRWVTTATWDDAPHMTDEAKRIAMSAYPEHEREARTKGIPMLGSGKIYNIDPNFFRVAPFKIPDHWKRSFGMDFGFENPTAIIWRATDPDTGVKYYYHEHYMAKQPPAVHAAVIKSVEKAAGFPIKGVCDPSGGGRTSDGDLTKETYKTKYDVDLEDASNSVEAGIHNIIDEITQGKIKVFSTLTNFWAEYAMYRREKGKIFKKNDHMMDAFRYCENSGSQVEQSKSDWMAQNTNDLYQTNGDFLSGRSDGWMYR